MHTSCLVDPMRSTHARNPRCLALDPFCIAYLLACRRTSRPCPLPLQKYIITLNYIISLLCFGQNSTFTAVAHLKLGLTLGFYYGIVFLSIH
jgi:hypothetical protein